MSKFTQAVIVNRELNEAAQMNLNFNTLLYTPEQLLLQAVEFTLYGAQNIRCHPQEPQTHINIISTLAYRLINILEVIHGDQVERIKVLEYHLVYDTLVLTVEYNP